MTCGLGCLLRFNYIKEMAYKFSACFHHPRTYLYSASCMLRAGKYLVAATVGNCVARESLANGVFPNVAPSTDTRVHFMRARLLHGGRGVN